METINRVWNYLKKPKVYKKIIFIAGMTVSVVASRYLIIKYLKYTKSHVKVSTFLTALAGGSVKEIVDYGDMITYRLADGSWAKTNVSQIPKSELISTATSKGIEYAYETSNVN